MGRAVFIHDEDIFAFECCTGGKGDWDFYRHRINDECRMQNDDFIHHSAF